MVYAFLYLKSLYLISLLLINCSGQDIFTVIRRTTGSRSDKFIVPSSKCGSSLPACSSYSGAINHDPTQCICACRYESSTFGFYNGGWVCLNNQKVRQRSACQFMFDGEAPHNPLKVVASGFSYKIILASISCTIDQSASRYLKCDNTWNAINVQSNIFQFLPLTEIIGRGQYRYTMKVNTVTSLAGRVVSLKVSCTNPSRSSCVLFKIAGQINCPVDFVSSTSTHTPSITNTNLRTTQISTSDVSTRNSSTEAPDPETGVANSDQNGASSGTVTAIVIVIILVIIIAVIIAFVIWKKRRGEDVLIMDHLINIARKIQSPRSVKKPEEPEEQIYAEIPDLPPQTRTTPNAPMNSGIYTFAFDDPNSAYAPPNQQNNQTPNEGPTDDRGYMVPVDSPIHIAPEDANKRNRNSNTKNRKPGSQNSRQVQQRSTYRGRTGTNDVAPIYDVLEAPGEPKAENHESENSRVCHNRQPSFPRRGRDGSFVSPAGVHGSEAGCNRYVTKQRRRPPSPPRKI